MKILILDGANQNTLAIVRYLGRHRDLELHVVGYNKLAQACYSKYVSKKFLFPSPQKKPLVFYENLKDKLQLEHYDLLMPVGFFSFEICMRNKEELRKYVQVILTNEESFALASNKLNTYRFAAEHNIPCPKTYFLRSKEEIRSLDVPYPVVIKSPFEMGKNVVEYAYSQQEMIFKFETLCKEYDFKEPSLPVVQQYITGEGYGFFAYYRDGVCLKKFSHHRIREYPVSGGSSVCAESFTDSEELERTGKKMLDLMKWNGVAMVEFKKHSDGEYKLMEINPKFWGSLELALAAGVDFPYCLVQEIKGEQITPNETFKQVRFQWLINGELFHFFARPSSFFKILRDLFRSKNDIRITDPLPNLVQVLLIFLHLYKKSVGK